MSKKPLCRLPINSYSCHSLEMNGANQSPFESVLSFVTGKPTQDKEKLRERGELSHVCDELQKQDHGYLWLLI